MAEKIIVGPLIQFLQRGKFGPNQLAFSPGFSSRDLAISLVMSWILAICTGRKIAGYLSDITGAFDRVCEDYLTAKLQVAGVGPNYLNFLDAYRQPRSSRVIVEGAASDDFEIFNTVFQGTVLGPPLWNLYFADVVVPAEENGEEAAAFADDLNVFKSFDVIIPNEELKRDMAVCRARVHKWGRTNRVTFDAGREHLVILHPTLGEGDPFKLLGCVMDCNLHMRQAIDKILGQVRPKMTAILRMKPHYDTRALINQFKTHLWGILEIHNGAFFHATSTDLARFDSLQRHFLNELGITEMVAFLDFNFAPPTLVFLFLRTPSNNL